MSKRIEIVIKGLSAHDPYILREIERGNFTVEIISRPPVPIFDPNHAPGAKPRVMGYEPNPEPPILYFLIGEEEDRLNKTARTLLDYFDNHGAKEFDKHFGTKGVEGIYFAEFLRKFLQEGDS